MTIWNKGTTTDVKKDCVTTFVIFNDDLQVLIRIFLDGFVISVKEILQKVFFGVRSVYFSWSSISVYLFELLFSDFFDDFYPYWLPTYIGTSQVVDQFLDVTVMLDEGGGV